MVAAIAFALRDLEIRGAGNLLSGRQSGHIRSVGIELYSSLLEQCVRELQGKEKLVEEIEPDLQINLPSYIPKHYIDDEALRLVTYRRFATCDDDEQLENLRREMQDRFGTLPREVENLIEIVALRNLAKNLRIRQLNVGPQKAVLNFDPSTPVPPESLLGILENPEYNSRMSGAYSLTMSTNRNDYYFCIQQVKNLLKELH